MPRWEWRTLGERFGDAEARLAEAAAERVEESDELYVLSVRSDASVKVRAELMDVKQLQSVNGDGLQQWKPILKAGFPLAAADVHVVLEALGTTAPSLGRSRYTLTELLDELVQPNPELGAFDVHKRRARHTVGGCMAELSEVRVEHGSARTIAVEAEDPDRVIAAVRDLGLASHPNVCLALGLKRLVGFG